jgi:hypothetical protein
MSENESYEQRVRRRRQAALDEFEADGRAKAQAVLDAWWQERLNAAADYQRMMRQLNPTGLKIW